MMDIQKLKQILGWCSVLNTILLVLSALTFMLLGDWIYTLYKDLFQMSSDDLFSLWFISLAVYKILIITFNIIPYIAIRLTENTKKS